MRHHHSHHERRGREHGEHRRRGGRRLFEGGELRLVLLKLIEAQPRHGYDLIREVEARAGGAYAPSPGVVYPTLTLLQDMGLVQEASESAGRKLFTITEAGRTHLADQAAETQGALDRLDALAEVRERTDAAPVARAMQNLKSALHNRLSEAGVDKTLILDVAAPIDEAAGKIERLRP